MNCCYIWVAGILRSTESRGGLLSRYLRIVYGRVVSGGLRSCLVTAVVIVVVFSLFSWSVACAVCAWQRRGCPIVPGAIRIRVEWFLEVCARVLFQHSIRYYSIFLVVFVLSEFRSSCLALWRRRWVSVQNIKQFSFFSSKV